MTVVVGSLEAHYALAASRLTRLPVRTVAGHWTRELGARAGVAVFPGPRNSPGNVTTAHVGRVCGYLWGGSATEQHKFPVFCTVADGVAEYSWYFNNLGYYDQIATRAAGDWRTACNLIEASPWSTGHYGGTLDVTAGSLSIAIARATGTLQWTNLRADPSRAHPPAARVPLGYLLAIVGTVRGESIGGEARWFKVRYGPRDGRIVYVHYSVAARAAV